MNVAWSDLENVQKPGDYSFRDGTITVTFAELAIWKNHPSAQFELMRKHPTQSAPKYVLGKQVEEFAPDNPLLIYESTNGDSWFLTRDPATGAAAVMHVPHQLAGPFALREERCRRFGELSPDDDGVELRFFVLLSFPV